jgi:predicted aminopeptidase
MGKGRMSWNSDKCGPIRWLCVLGLPAVLAGAAGCGSLGFYGQAIKGQYQIVAHRKSIEKVIADPQTPARLRGQLGLVRRLRGFAEKELNLPVNGHYRKYADLHRPYVVWNVQAAPQFSTQPKSWRYPLVGRLEYRGYFSGRGATNCARSIAADGYDVYVDGVEAYSTLGWFADPVLNTFVYREEPGLAEVLFHELAHQRLFVGSDTDFNEAFATTVGQEGTRRWLLAGANTNLYERYSLALRRNEQFVHLVLEARSRLERVYGDTRDSDGKVKPAANLPAPVDELLDAKRDVFDDLRRQYERLKTEWGGFAGHDAWFAGELNNARLNSVAEYYDLVPGFDQLLRVCAGDMEEFYRSAERLSKMSKKKRRQWLEDLAKGSTKWP